jgi:tetratricopeptide (TPR) repeat protein
LLFLVAIGSLPAAEPSLKDARRLWLRGNIEEARAKYDAVLKKDAKNAAAVVGISRTYSSQGEYDKALGVVETALQAMPKSPDLLARRAEVLYLRGRWDDAEKAAEAALKIARDNFLGRWVRAQIYRDRGDLKKADAEFRWFVRTYTERSNADNDVKDPDELAIIGQAGAENARWHSLSDQFDDIQEVYLDAIKADKDFWWGEYYLGMLFLEKHNPADALEAFGKAEAINASAAEVLVGRGLAALQKLDMKDAEGFARRALDLNPKLTDALRLRADVLLAAGDLKAAESYLKQALAVNPREEATLGRLAACHYLSKQQGAFDALVAEVAKHDSRPGAFYADLAERLEERRRFDDAEKYYHKSIGFRPMLAAPRASLGLLYMRMGREEEARKILEEALKADEFNIRVSNTLKVLKHLDGYARLPTAHFLLRYDEKNDKVLAHYMAKYLERIYDKLARDFKYRPKGPILIEVFNNHHMFSGRTIALPDLHTIGACTGRMVTMVSPHDQAKVIGKPFNWARVIKHELVHIFNLEQTNFLIPHWYTEGLAVENEGFPRPPLWNKILLRRVPNRLLNLDTINMGFIRPRTPEEWQLAYLQSQLYVQYLKDKYGGVERVGELLEAYRKGMDTASAIKTVCKVDKAEFEKGYLRYLDGIVKELAGKAAGKARSFEELKKSHQAKPDDPDTAAQLADRYLDLGEKAEARKLSDAVLKDKPKHPLAAYVRARLHIDGGETNKAMALLNEALDKGNPEVKVAGLLGKLYFDAEDYKEAAKKFEIAREADPYESQWLTKLAEAYGRSNQTGKLIEVLGRLAGQNADDLDIRKRLATLALKEGKPAQAERWAREALEIDVLDKDALTALREALKKQNKDDDLKELNELLGK